MDDMNPRAQMGNNNPPPYDPEIISELERRVRELSDAGGAWLDLGAVRDDEQAGKLNDFLTQIRNADKQIEAARKAAKEPHLEAGRLVDKAFNTMALPLSKLSTALKAPLAAYAAEKQRRLDEERRAREAEARRAAEEAEAKRRAAEARNDVIAQAAAEEAAKEAAKAAAQAAKPVRAQIASATGGGRTMSARRIWKARIDNMNLAFGRYRDDPVVGAKLREVLEAAAAAEKRANHDLTVAGVHFYQEESIA